MTQDVIIKYLTEHKEQFKKDFGITKIGLFVSYARNEAKNDSDIDILKDLTDIYEKKSLLKEIMEKAFDKKVDIAREKYLKPLVKDEVLKEVKYV
mgnify:FL=1